MPSTDKTADDLQAAFSVDEVDERTLERVVQLVRSAFA